MLQGQKTIKFKSCVLFLINNMVDYKDLLKKARDSMPQSVYDKERFEIPKVRGHIQGNRTIVNNFLDIASTLGREPQHLLKYVLKGLATPGEIKKSGSVIFGTKVPASRINEKIKQYANEFIFCSVCGKPDTKLEKEGALRVIRCTACGTKKPVRSLG